MTLQLVECAACGACWALAVAWGAPEGPLGSAVRGLLGGLAAFVVASGGYALLERAGMRVTWEEVTVGGTGGAATAGAIGFVEESAKLLGLALASVGARPAARASVVRTVLAVSAAFATFECMLVLGGAGRSLVLLRALLAPVAHATLAAPLGLVLAGGRNGLRWAAPALLLSAGLHAASDLSLASPGLGRIGYAVVLATPAVFLHLHARFAWAREQVRGGGRPA